MERFKQVYPDSELAITANLKSSSSFDDRFLNLAKLHNNECYTCRSRFKLQFGVIYTDRSYCYRCEKLFCRESFCFSIRDGLCNVCQIVEDPDVSPATKLRSEIIQGNAKMFQTSENTTDWMAPTWKLSVFVSSTFTDTHIERNFLMDELLPKLKKHGRKDGIEVNFSDMRWGIVDENTKEHLTWIHCQRELERCEKESMGIFLLSLQSEKYGYMPLPRTIDKSALDNITVNSTEDSTLLMKWYILDSNANPPQYVLRNLDTKDIEREYWAAAFQPLSNLLAGVRFDNKNLQLNICDSVTEYEVRTAMQIARDIATLGTSRLVWMRRQFRESIIQPTIHLKLGDQVWLLKQIEKEIFDRRLEEIGDICQENMDILKAWYKFDWDKQCYIFKYKFRQRQLLRGNEVPKILLEILSDEVFASVISGDTSLKEVDTRELLEVFDSSLYNDLLPVDVQKKYDILLETMTRRFPSNACKVFQFASYIDYITKNESWQLQFGRWKEEASDLLEESLESLIHIKRSWMKDGIGLGLPGRELSELLHHLEWAHKKCEHYFESVDDGGEPYSTQAIRHLCSIHKRVLFDSPFSCIDLAIFGKSGGGKTALMSNIFKGFLDNLGTNASNIFSSVIIRFCGTSPGSNSGYSLVMSICHQINFSIGRHFDPTIRISYSASSDAQQNQQRYILGMKYQPNANVTSATTIREQSSRYLDEKSSEKVLTAVRTSEISEGSQRKEVYKKLSSMTYEEIVFYFHSLLHSYAVVLFIDAIDQLNNGDLARSHISFLKTIKHLPPHPLTKVIVSCLPDDDDYWYGCATQLDPLCKAGMLKYFDVTGTSSAAEAVSVVNNIVDKLLQNDQRCLNDYQRQILRARISEEPTALYGLLAFRVVREWTSDLPRELCILSGKVTDIINQIFDRIGRSYGSALTEAAITFISLSLRGVTDTEMIDLLSLDEEVCKAVNAYNIAKKVPTHVWSRLRGDLTGLLVEGEDGCLHWYHRQLKETAFERVTKRGNLILYHTIMAKYYGNIGSDEHRSQGISLHPLILNSIDNRELWLPTDVKVVDVNNRRCSEAASHMIKANMLEEAESELCSLDSINARARCNELFDVISQLATLKQKLPNSERVDHFHRWLIGSVHTIMNRSDEIADVIFKSALQEPVISIVRQQALKSITMDLRYFVCYNPDRKSNWLAQAEDESKNNSLSHFGDLLQRLQGHNLSVSSVVLAKPTRLDSAEMAATIVSGSWDGSIRLWDSLTGQEFNKFELDPLIHSNFSGANVITCLLYFPHNEQILSGSIDGILRLWDIRTGRFKSLESMWTSQAEEQLDTVKNYKKMKKILISSKTAGESRSSVDLFQDRIVAMTHCENEDSFIAARINKIIKVKYETSRSASQFLLHSTEVREADGITCVATSGSLIVAGSVNHIIYVWYCVGDGESPTILSGHKGLISGVAILPGGIFGDSRRIVSCSWDKGIFIWKKINGHSAKGWEIVSAFDATGRDFLRTLSIVLPQPSTSRGNNSSNRIITSSSSHIDLFDYNQSDDNLSLSKVYAPDNGQAMQRITGISCAAFPDGRIVSGNDDCSLIIWNAHLQSTALEIDAMKQDMIYRAICKGGGDGDVAIDIGLPDISTIELQKKFNYYYFGASSDDDDNLYQLARKLWDKKLTLGAIFNGKLFTRVFLSALESPFRSPLGIPILLILGVVFGATFIWGFFFICKMTCMSHRIDSFASFWRLLLIGSIDQLVYAIIFFLIAYGIHRRKLIVIRITLAGAIVWLLFAASASLQLNIEAEKPFAAIFFYLLGQLFWITIIVSAVSLKRRVAYWLILEGYVCILAYMLASYFDNLSEYGFYVIMIVIWTVFFGALSMVHRRIKLRVKNLRVALNNKYQQSFDALWSLYCVDLLNFNSIFSSIIFAMERTYKCDTLIQELPDHESFSRLYLRGRAVESIFRRKMMNILSTSEEGRIIEDDIIRNVDQAIEKIHVNLGGDPTLLLDLVKVAIEFDRPCDLHNFLDNLRRIHCTADNSDPDFQLIVHDEKIIKLDNNLVDSFSLLKRPEGIVFYFRIAVQEDEIKAPIICQLQLHLADLSRLRELKEYKDFQWLSRYMNP